MQAVVFRGVGDIRLEDVPLPKLEAPTDAIVHLTASAICGTDLHFVRGTVGPLRPGTILGHEGVGIVEIAGPEVRSFRSGDRVVVCSTIACGVCVYCRNGEYSQCDRANPRGPASGTAFFGGPEASGPFQGLQAQKARIPFAATTLVSVPSGVSDEQAILASDIFPTGYFAADLADIRPGRTLAIFGCGPVGQCAILSAKLMNAGRIFAVDAIPSRLERARAQGAEVIDYNREDPVEALRQLTGGIGVDRVIDAVGVDANRPRAVTGTKAEPVAQGEPLAKAEHAANDPRQVAPQPHAGDGRWQPGDGPAQVLTWAVQALAKAGRLAIVGVYPEAARIFPIGQAMNKNLTLAMGNCPHRKYVPQLLEMIAAGLADPAVLLTKAEPITDAIAAYQAFDQRQPGWLKVKLDPQRQAQLRAA
ncbi:MAG: zinc-dependent alcohol dehydrogenase [Terriglobales bacterium]